MADGRILASLHSGARGDHATAVREAEAAASEWPQQPALASYVAAAHRAVMLDGGLSPEVRQTAFESAARVLEDAVARAPSSDLAAKLGDLYRDRGDAAAAGSEANDAWTTALEWYDRSLQLQPTFPAALEAYASTLERLGDYDGASSLYQSALTIDPPRHSARAGLVRVSLAANDLSRAREALSVGLAVDASALGSALDDAVDTRADQVRVLQSRLLFALETGAVESAATLADQLRARAPDDPISRELMTDADAARD
jgi:tetratricopeptide (TPR) repeat protein